MRYCQLQLWQKGNTNSEQKFIIHTHNKWYSETNSSLHSNWIESLINLYFLIYIYYVFYDLTAMLFGNEVAKRDWRLSSGMLSDLIKSKAVLRSPDCIRDGTPANTLSPLNNCPISNTGKRRTTTTAFIGRVNTWTILDNILTWVLTDTNRRLLVSLTKSALDVPSFMQQESRRSRWHHVTRGYNVLAV